MILPMMRAADSILISTRLRKHPRARFWHLDRRAQHRSLPARDNGRTARAMTDAAGKSRTEDLWHNAQNAK
jgi:hypothetical protein